MDLGFLGTLGPWPPAQGWDGGRAVFKSQFLELLVAEVILRLQWPPANGWSKECEENDENTLILKLNDKEQKWNQEGM